MLDGPGMRMLDGAVIHFGNPDRLDCLIIYGEAWRAAASAGLVALLPAGQVIEPGFLRLLADLHTTIAAVDAALAECATGDAS
jgi:hypothetical protein